MFDKVSDRILELLVRNNMKQIDLARICNISANAITNYIKKNRLPDTESIFRIAKALNTTVEWLLTGEDKTLKCEQPEPEPLIMEFNIEELDAEQKELLMIFAHLGNAGKFAVKDFARYQLSAPPNDDLNEHLKRAEKSPCFPPSNHSNNGGEIA